MARKRSSNRLAGVVLAFCLALLLGHTTKGEWRTVGDFRAVGEIRTNGVVVLTTGGVLIGVEFFDLDVVRVRYAPTRKFERPFSYAFDYSNERKTPLVTVRQTPREVIVTNAFGAKVTIAKSGSAISIFDQDGELVAADDPRRPAVFDRATGEFVASKKRRSEVETYYGLGEKTFPGMSRNGEYIVNWNTDTFSYPAGLDPTYQTIPFFYALHQGKAYGLFFNNTFRSFFDLGKTSPDRYSFGANGGELDYFVFTGGKDRSPRKVLEDYANLTGKTPLPPIWALGNQQSRWSYKSEGRIREIADGFRSRRIPADVIYFDIDYMDGFRVFTWDKTRFPDPKRLAADLRADGFRSVVIIDPGIKTDDAYAVYADGKRAGAFVRNPDGTELNARVWPGNSAFPDFTDPKARAWWGEQYRGHVDEGIAGFWNDMNEPGVFITENDERPEIYHHPRKTFPYDTPHVGDGLRDTHRRYHNVYGMQMARASFEGVKKLAPDRRPFILTRAGFAGVQRYSAVWTGDNRSTWEHLAISIPMLANLSVSGVPFVGADAGGFDGMPSGELFARWYQAAALTPFFRSHSHEGAPDKEPWVFGDEFTRINRSTAELRYRFLPYLYTLFRGHERTGAPVMRPLWFEFPTDTATYLINDQFLIGRDLLVAPVVREGERARAVYFPKGSDWVDWWTGERYAGGQSATIPAPLDRLPIFIRAGSVIPVQSVIQHTGEMPGADVTLVVGTGIKPGITESAELYQDAGDGYGYRRSEWREIKVTHRQGSLRLERFGDFQGQRIRYVEALGIGAAPKEVRADGVVLASEFDAANKRLRIEVPENVREITLVR